MILELLGLGFVAFILYAVWTVVNFNTRRPTDPPVYPSYIPFIGHVVSFGILTCPARSGMVPGLWTSGKLRLISWDSENYVAWGGLPILLEILSEIDLSQTETSILLNQYLKVLFSLYKQGTGGGEYIPGSSQSFDVQSGAIEIAIELVNSAIKA